MVDPDLIKGAVAGGVILVTAVLATRTAVPHGRDRASTAESAARVETPEPRAPIPVGRPRILTGEPAVPEQRKPAPMRALRLVGGLGVLAVAGAIGLIAVVRALIAMFQRIGG